MRVVLLSPVFFLSCYRYPSLSLQMSNTPSVFQCDAHLVIGLCEEKPKTPDSVEQTGCAVLYEWTIDRDDRKCLPRFAAAGAAAWRRGSFCDTRTNSEHRGRARVRTAASVRVSCACVSSSRGPHL